MSVMMLPGFGPEPVALAEIPPARPALRLHHGKVTRDDIQTEMIECVDRLRLSGRKCGILQAATGTGKTHTAARWVIRGRARKARFLFLAHRDILIEQTAAEFKDMGIRFAVEQAGRRAVDLIRFDPTIECIIASKDSMQNSRLKLWPTDYFTDIITDETDLAAVTTYDNVYRHFLPGVTFHLGLTATPYRADGTPLYGAPGSLFGDGGFRDPYPLEGLPPGTKVHEAIAFKYTLPVAIANGHLADIVAVPATTEIDLSDVRVSKGKNADFNRGDLDDRISAKVDVLANQIREHLDRLSVRKAVAFCPDVGSSRALADALTAVGVSSKAVWTGSKDHPLSGTAKKAVLNQYKHGMFRVIVSCEVLTAGWNDPETEMAIMVRPTKSLRLFFQMVGRCTRILENKPKCYVLGFQWSGAKGVCSTLDLFMEDEPSPKVREAAKAMKLPLGVDYDPQEEIRKLKEKLEKEELEKARKLREKEDREAEGLRVRVEAKKRDIKHKWREFSVYNAGDILGIAQPLPDRKKAKADPPTPGQIEVLRDYGMGRATGLDREGAQKIIDQCLERTFHNKATPDQVRRLIDGGMPMERARELSASEAEHRIRNRPVSDKMRAFLARQMGWAHSRIDSATQSEAVRVLLDWKKRRGY